MALIYKTMTGADMKRKPRDRNKWIVNYGTERIYLLRRLREQAPAIHKRVIAGEYRSIRAAAIEAGIIQTPPPLAGLERLFQAWRKASLDDRQAFLLLAGEEIEAADRGEYLNQEEPESSRGGPRPYKVRPGVEQIPELEALLQADQSLSQIAGRLGVAYHTLARWRAGQTRPSQALREQLSELAKEEKG